MPRIIVITGDGKGKTTSALGMVLRALGYEMKIAIIQFIKSRSDVGEITALKNFKNVEIAQCGSGFIMHSNSENFVKHRSAARKGLDLALEKLKDTSIDMIILDEICSTPHHQLLSEDSLIATLKNAHEKAIVICTGRFAPDSLINLADTVSVITSIKHGFDNGIKAQKGVEL